MSTDGDAHRPLLVYDTGRVIPGNILSQITARATGADTVVTSKTGTELSGNFIRVIRIKMGLPFVIVEMAAASRGVKRMSAFFWALTRRFGGSCYA